MAVKDLASALSTAGLAVIATLGVLLPRTAVASPTFVQGAAASTGSRVPSLTVTLTHPVAQGDLLVGWFAQYNAPGHVQVSDNVNGTWTRAVASVTFDDDTGDIALYYCENSQAAPSGVTITISASATAYLQGTVADYSGVALAGSLDQIAAAHGNEGKVVDSGATPAVGAGELVFAALITDALPGSVTPGSSQGIPYTRRAQTSSGSVFGEDITWSAAGPQHGTATLTNAVEWYAVCAVFHQLPTTPPVPPSTPIGLEATSVASTRVALSWSPSSGSVAGYTVYRDGFAIGMTGPDTTIFLDSDVTPSTAYTYSVDAFDLLNDHSVSSEPLTVTTPAVSPEFVQGVGASPGTRLTSLKLTLSEPVLAGDLLVGWFGQYNASGQVRVSDNVNGSWTRSVSTTWGGTGDIALYYRENSAPAPSGLVITVSASASAYLQEAIAHFRNVATVGALDQAVVSHGTGNYASAGPTASVPAGELVVAAVLTGGQPRWLIPGSSQRVPYLVDAHNGSDASDLEDILSSAAGPQEAGLTLGTGSNWNMVLATFRPAGASTTTTSPGSTTTTLPTTTTTTTSTSTTTTATIPGTTTGVTSSANPSVSGQPVTFTATVKARTAGAGTPTGTVTFNDGASALGTGTLDGAGQATFVTSTLAVGAHPITASYGGDATFSGSTSSTLTQTVKKASTATVVSSSANPSLSGQAVTFTATVTAKSPGAGTPTGTVTFKDGSTILGTGTLDGSGQGTFVTSTLAVGSHSITASYGGDANFNGSTSPRLTQTVKYGTTTSVSSSLNPSVFGQSVKFTATVTANSPGTGTPSGKVTFKDGETAITNCSNLSLNKGQASCTTSSLSVGSHSITATYGGSSTFLPSTSPALTQTVN